MSSLSELGADTHARVTGIGGDNHFQSRITSIGVTVGSEVTIVQNNKNQPILLYGRDTLIALNRKEAEKVAAEVLNK